ncbi:hypothetical protein OOT00_05810 [Desulfobotulus sp. H1]|uniref:Uncharacterized protein n=1 Tax=Desulfobotulus pelophilus TaxID=2823377 RepID=A0ABT3N7S2_9BACT|nr:hypothetical protein [Desulfobotulus pelophilus]MCW7753502.1 hypothetical protein [Desulfobotulus pelophilus]
MGMATCSGRLFLGIIYYFVTVQHILFKIVTALISTASYGCKASWLFASDVAIVSDQSFEALCERSGKLSEPPQRQRAYACYDNQKAYPACGGEFLPLPYRARSSKNKIASRVNSLDASAFIWQA